MQSRMVWVINGVNLYYEKLLRGACVLMLSRNNLVNARVKVTPAFPTVEAGGQRNPACYLLPCLLSDLIAYLI